MYVSNKLVKQGVASALGVVLLSVGAYAAKNYDRFVNFKEDVFYSHAISERSSSTERIMQTVGDRVHSMTADELKQSATGCENLQEKILDQYAAILAELGNRKYTESQREAMRHMLRSLESRLEGSK